MTKKLLFIFNPHAGKSQINVELVDILDVFTKGGYEVTVYPTQAPLDGYEKVKNNGDEYNLIVVSGGDGTLSEIVSGIMTLPNKDEINLGYIPSGSTNDFASSLGISKNMKKAAQDIVEGVPFACDIGKFNQSNFNYVAGFGAFTDVSYETPQETKNVFGYLAYVFEGISRLPKLPSYAMKIECNGETMAGEFILGMVMNTNSIAGIKSGNLRKADLADGEFEVLLVRTPANILELQPIVTGLLKGDTKGEGFLITKTNKITFETDDDIRWTLDGEYGGNDKKVEISVLNRAINFIVSDEKSLTTE